MCCLHHAGTPLSVAPAGCERPLFRPVSSPPILISIENHIVERHLSMVRRKSNCAENSTACSPELCHDFAR